jgi:hypothetical protein
MNSKPHHLTQFVITYVLETNQHTVHDLVLSILEAAMVQVISNVSYHLHLVQDVALHKGGTEPARDHGKGTLLSTHGQALSA